MKTTESSAWSAVIVNADDTHWTELALAKRPDCVDRVDIDPVSSAPLVLKVVSESRESALRAAAFLASTTGGRLL